MSSRDIVVIGASAGGIGALETLLPAFPADYPGTIFIVLHRGPGTAKLLAHFLSIGSVLPVQAATDGARFERGHVYVAGDDSHLVIERGTMRLEKSPREKFVRPCIDVLFRTAALAYGRRVVGVILSGTLDDGTAGLRQIKKHGGVAIVQDPEEAEQGGMIQSAINNVSIDYQLPLRAIAVKLMELAAGPPREPGSARVLIVEDEEIVAKNLENRLAKLGYEVTGSVSMGQAAIDHVARERPDVVLMDMPLHGPMEGMEAARKIRERFQVPVVDVTTLKPFRRAQLHAAIELALDRRDRENR